MKKSAIGDLNSLADCAGPLMAGFPAPWCIAGGWAMDLFLGRVTRAHDDVEIAIFRQDQLALHNHFARWHFNKGVAGRRESWTADEFLELPIHEIHGRSLDIPEESLEILLNQRDETDWIFRRNPSVRLPLDRAMIASAVGLPILAPEIVLLYKSNSSRPKDEADFQAALDQLGPARCQWLAEAIGRGDPTHRWLNRLEPVTIRPAEPADAARVVRIHFQAVHETARGFYPENVLQSWSSRPDADRIARVSRGMADGQQMLVAEVRGTVCGFGSIVAQRSELRAVYVDPAFSRRGIGSAILRQLEWLAARRGVKRLSLDASLNAEAFYLKHGYTTLNRGLHRLSSGVEMECVKMFKEIPSFAVGDP